MKKSSYLLGMMALGLLSLSSAAGCSSEDPQDNTPSGGSGGAATGGAGAATGGAGAGGAAAGAGTGGAKMTGTKLNPPASYTILSGADATAGATPAPAAYGKNCAACHGDAGQGVASLGTEIRHTPGAYSTYVIRNGRPLPSLMSAWPEGTLPAADLTAIQTWLAGQPKPTTPQGLYLDYCANCHGPTGGGGSVPVKASGLATATIKATVRAGVGTDPAQRGTYMPAFGTDMLTEDELTQVAQFLGGT